MAQSNNHPNRSKALHPAQHEALECRCAKFPNEWLNLTYSHERGFFEPVTNLDAEPVVGRILEWRYAHPEQVGKPL